MRCIASWWYQPVMYCEWFSIFHVGNPCHAATHLLSFPWKLMKGIHNQDARNDEKPSFSVHRFVKPSRLVRWMAYLTTRNIPIFWFSNRFLSTANFPLLWFGSSIWDFHWVVSVMGDEQKEPPTESNVIWWTTRASVSFTMRNPSVWHQFITSRKLSASEPRNPSIW